MMVLQNRPDIGSGNLKLCCSLPMWARLPSTPRFQMKQCLQNYQMAHFFCRCPNEADFRRNTFRMRVECQEICCAFAAFWVPLSGTSCPLVVNGLAQLVFPRLPIQRLLGTISVQSKRGQETKPPAGPWFRA